MIPNIYVARPIPRSSSGSSNCSPRCRKDLAAQDAGEEAPQILPTRLLRCLDKDPSLALLVSFVLIPMVALTKSHIAFDGFGYSFLSSSREHAIEH
jgi:hypothetical protein